MAAQLAVLDPDFTYAFDEGMGTAYANGGKGGTYDLPPVRTTTNERLNFRMPGMIRGNPAEYAYWTFAPANDSIPGLGAAGLAALNATGWTTGCIMVVLSVSQKSEVLTVLELRYGNNFARITVELNGRLRFTLFQSSPGNQYQVETPDNTIVNGEPYLVMIYQRADGNGIQVKINDVAQTLTLTQAGTGTSADAWFDAIFTNTATHTDTTINNQNRVTNFGVGSAAIIQRPTWWINFVPTDAQMSDLFTNGCNFSGIPQELFHTYLSLATDNKPRYYIPMSIANAATTSNISLPQFAPLINDVNYGSNSLMRVPSFSSTPADFVEDTDIVTQNADEFRYHKFNADGTEISPKTSTNTPTNLLATETTGTVIIAFKFDDGIAVGLSRSIWALQLNNTGTAIIQLRVGAATGPIYTLLARISDGTNEYIITSVGEISLNDYVVLTVVQDGTSGLKLFINKDEASVSPSGLLDEDSWINALPKDAADGLPQELSIGGGIFGDDLDGNGMGTFAWLPNALTPTEISQVHDAHLGIFPEDTNGTLPPDGGFNDTLNETGNETDPNGPGPDHYWRHNAAAAPLPDVGIAVVDGSTITTGGDPDFQVEGPLINDPTNAAIYFDGQGDYFEVGVDGITGQLVTFAIGTVGFFIALNSQTKENIVYSQANDLGTAKIQWGITNKTITFLVQTSAGNSAKYEASIEVDNLDFVFCVMTNDGSEYKWYVQGAEDPAAVLTLEGTGAEGDWFNSITATRSALGALANSTFTTETTVRDSEVFIYKVVLTAAQIAALFEAAVRDGILGSAETLGILQFEEVTFLNGGFADVRMDNAEEEFAQVLQVSESEFIGGYQAADAQSVYARGGQRVQVRGSEFNLNDTVTDGRAVLVGTTQNPAVEPTVEGTVIVAKNTMKNMGNADRAAVFLESGFGGNVQENRMFDSVGAAVGWRGDAQRVQVQANQITGLVSGVAGIRVQQGLNTRIGVDWLVEKNILENVQSGIRVEGANLGAGEFARRLNIRRNKVDTATDEGIYLDQVQDALVQMNELLNVTEGIRAKGLEGKLVLRRNTIQQLTNGIIMNESTLQPADVVLDRNVIRGQAAGTGITVGNLTRATLLFNELVNLSVGLQLGNINNSVQLSRNMWQNVATPLELLASTTQNGLDIGLNNFATSLAAVQDLTVVTNAVNVTANWHTITSGSAVDLNTIGGPGRQGATVILLLATGSSNITAKDGVGDMQLAGDFLMANAGKSQLWLVYDGTNWCELARLA